MASRETSAIKIGEANEEALRIIEQHDPEAAAKIRNTAPHGINPEKDVWTAFAHQSELIAALAEQVQFLDGVVADMLNERRPAA